MYNWVWVLYELLPSLGLVVTVCHFDIRNIALVWDVRDIVNTFVIILYILIISEDKVLFVDHLVDLLTDFVFVWIQNKWLGIGQHDRSLGISIIATAEVDYGEAR